MHPCRPLAATLTVVLAVAVTPASAQEPPRLLPEPVGGGTVTLPYAELRALLLAAQAPRPTPVLPPPPAPPVPPAPFNVGAGRYALEVAADGNSVRGRVTYEVQTFVEGWTTIVLLTASTEQELMLRGLRAGADDFLLKPINPTELLVRLHSHLQLVEVRRRATARQSDERFRLIFESARDCAIFTFNAQRQVTSWNPGAEVLTGFSAAEILGRATDNLFTPEDRERGVPAKEMAEAKRTGHFHNERWHLRKDRSRFWGSGVVMPLREDGPEGSGLKILRDHTEAHQMEEDRARLPAAEQDDHIVVEVSDTGLGIEGDALAKIFEPFEQGEPERTRLYGGLGLGLAISHAIVAAHGGQLTAESPGRNRGATFRVRLSTITEAGIAPHSPDAPGSEYGPNDGSNRTGQNG